MDVEAIANRLQLLEDERDITRMMYRYAHAMYNGDLAMFLDCFTEDAEIERSRHGRLVSGRSAQIEFFNAITHIPQAYHKHVLVEPLIEIDGDTATVSSDFLYVQDVDGPLISHFGHYVDAVVRCPDGAWRLRRRALQTEAVARHDVSTIAGSPGTIMTDAPTQPTS